MRRGRRSRTAEATAVLRAAHQVIDQSPRVLEDPFALRLLDPAARWALVPSLGPRRLLGPLLDRQLRRWGTRRPALGSRRIRAQVVVRSRYVEDRLEQWLNERDNEEDPAQLVILAAGLDSFALRRRELADRLRVFEVDHPATQQWKRGRIEAVGEPWPSNLELVPCDFERQTLSESLARSAFDPSRPALFSWLGVSYYLTTEAIEETFRFVAAQAPGSELVFDYWRLDPPQADLDRALLDAIRMSVRWQEERMLSFFAPEQMNRLLARCGLEVVEHLDAREANQLYLEGRRDGLLMPSFAHLAAVAALDT